MAITFNCTCGKILSSRDADAGLKAVCPNCGRRVVVPGQIQTPNPDAELREKALKVDAWIHGHQKQILYSSIVIALIACAGLLGFRWWRSIELYERPDPPATVADSSPSIALDPNADPEQWRTNFDSFAVAIKEAIANNELLQDKFTGEEITWEVTFEDFLQRHALYFEEAESLRDADHGIRIWATVLPSQVEHAEKLVPGQKIRLRGKMGPVMFGRSAEHPLGYTTFRPQECSIEELEPAPNEG